MQTPTPAMTVVPTRFAEPTPTPEVTASPTDTAIAEPTMTARGEALFAVAASALRVGDASLLGGDRVTTDRAMLNAYARLLDELVPLGPFGPSGPGFRAPRDCDDVGALVQDSIAAEETVVTIDLARAVAGDFSPINASEDLAISQAVDLSSRLTGAIRSVVC